MIGQQTLLQIKISFIRKRRKKNIWTTTSSLQIAMEEFAEWLLEGHAGCRVG